MLARAVDEDRVLVTENMRDFVPLVDSRRTAGHRLVPVVFALKASMPAGGGAMGHAMAQRLDAWAAKNPEPYVDIHWLE